MTRAGYGVDRIDRQELSWQQMTAMIDGLMDDHTSHTFASAAGWAYVPSAEEVFFYNELDVKLAMNRGKNQPAPPPTPRPWEKKRDRFVAPTVDPQSRKRRDALMKRLGLAGPQDEAKHAETTE